MRELDLLCVPTSVHLLQASEALSSREASDGLVCHQCFGQLTSKFTTCVLCGKAWHLFCTSPELAEVPADEWVCPGCRAAEDDPYIKSTAGRTPPQKFQADAQRFFRHLRVASGFQETQQSNTSPRRTDYEYSRQEKGQLLGAESFYFCAQNFLRGSASKFHIGFVYVLTS